MRCEEVNELIQRALDEELNETDTQIMQAHIERCEECRGFYHRLQLLQTNLESIPKVNPPFSIVDSILPEIERMDLQTRYNDTTNRVNRYLFTKKWIASFGAAAAGIILIVSFIGYQNGGFRESADNAQNAAVYSSSAKNEAVMDTASSDTTSLQKRSESERNASENREVAKASKIESDTSEGAMLGITTVNPSQNPKEMTSLASPDGEYIAVYNEIQIEVKSKDGTAIVVLTAQAGQQFSDIEWSDPTHLQYTAKVEGTIENWIIDVTTGEQTQKPFE